MDEHPEVKLNRISFICPEKGMISAPAGALTMVTFVDRPGGFMVVACPCGKEHRIVTK